MDFRAGLDIPRIVLLTKGVLVLPGTCPQDEGMTEEIL